MEEAKRITKEISEKRQNSQPTPMEQAISKEEQSLGRRMNRHERRSFASRLMKAIRRHAKKQ